MPPQRITTTLPEDSPCLGCGAICCDPVHAAIQLYLPTPSTEQPSTLEVEVKRHIAITSVNQARSQINRLIGEILDTDPQNVLSLKGYHEGVFLPLEKSEVEAMAYIDCVIAGRIQTIGHHMCMARIYALFDCKALDGENTTCTIYKEKRPKICTDLSPSDCGLGLGYSDRIHPGARDQQPEHVREHMDICASMRCNPLNTPEEAALKTCKIS